MRNFPQGKKKDLLTASFYRQKHRLRNRFFSLRIENKRSDGFERQFRGVFEG